jgi:hypothetical protein
VTTAERLVSTDIVQSKHCRTTDSTTMRATCVMFTVQYAGSHVQHVIALKAGQDNKLTSSPPTLK